MPSKYYLTLTNYGSDLIAQAHESTPLNLKNLVIGDANGVPYDPLTAIDRTHLVNQKASVLIQNIDKVENVVRVTATVGANIGGFNIHEIGLTDETGQLVYIGNYHGGFKSVFEDGAGGELSFSIDIKGEAANKINLTIDPNIITATQAWVARNYVKVIDIIDNLTSEDADKPVSAKQAKHLQDHKLDKDENAVSASKLETARMINGIEFDGTQDINLPTLGTRSPVDVTALRALNTVYTNTDPTPRFVFIFGGRSNSARNEIIVDGVIVSEIQAANNYYDSSTMVGVVNPGKEYEVTGSDISRWVEQ